MFNHRAFIRLIYSTLVLTAIAATVALVAVLQTKNYVFEKPIAVVTEVKETVIPFPVSVDPELGIILDQAAATVASSEPPRRAMIADSWWSKIVTVFSRHDWYQNLASPVSRIIVIWPGERKEEIAENIGTVLRWNDTEKTAFIEEINKLNPGLSEGTFYPGQYVAHREATPTEIATLIHTEFQNKILNRYTEEVATVVPLEDALIIASLLEREASDFQNMREISGVIWNRLFIDMPLQLDATLQYAQGPKTSGGTWWPIPRPADKFVESPFNTYANKGLPPAPIANPSTDSVMAALNPLPTDCYYYFHDAEQGYYCSGTYPEHVEKLKAAYGSGQ